MNPNPIAALSRYFLTALVVAIPAAYAETSISAFSEEPDKSMAAAHESFIEGERVKSAADIHQAAAYVKKESEKVGADSKDAVKKSGEALDKLGDGVKDGTVKSVDELKKGFASVDHALASAWLKMAEATKKSGKDASQDLKRAGASLDASAKWSGHELEGGAMESINAVKQASRATGEGVKVGAEEVGRWFKGIGDGIKHLGGKL